MDEGQPRHAYRPATLEFTLGLFGNIACHYSDRPLPIKWSVRDVGDGQVEIVGSLEGLEIEASIKLSAVDAGTYLFEAAYNIAEKLERAMRARFGGKRNE